MQTPRPLTADRIESLLQERADIAARPRQTPREVLAKWLDNLGAGVGVGVGAAVLLWLVGAPDSVLYTVPVALGLLAFALLMAWRATLDERSDWRNPRAVRRAVNQMRQQYMAETHTMRRQLDAAYDEIESLERGLDRMTKERDAAVSELTRERTAAQTNGRSTFVPAVEVTPQELADATEMIRWRYQFNAHLSRRKAESTKQWPQTRWEAAQQVLADAGVIAVLNGVTNYPKTLDEALQRLGSYMLQARKMAVPAINRALGVALYVESDEA